MNDWRIREATQHDLPTLERIRAAAFTPIFASFRDLLGDSLYEIVQAREDEEQSTLLTSLLVPASPWQLHVAEGAEGIVGFVAFQLNRESRVGEIGLNAVDPVHSGQGVGTLMYEFALSRMKAAGMRAATVATGADESHAPARHAYEKVGFSKTIPSVWMCREL
ncbi:MAG: N-acetyltransferase family protein [Halomonadaceae bacterium]|jgi:ribosomal protein S18 acetylase RimI-like enzyme